MIGRRSFPFRMLQGPAPSPAQRVEISSRGSRPLADEGTVGNHVPAGEARTHALASPAPPDDCHHGSPDLTVWPPSIVEDHWASRALRDERGAYRQLLSQAQSDARAKAIILDVIRRRDEANERMLTRICGAS